MLLAFKCDIEGTPMPTETELKQRCAHPFDRWPNPFQPSVPSVQIPAGRAPGIVEYGWNHTSPLGMLPAMLVRNVRKMNRFV